MFDILGYNLNLLKFAKQNELIQTSKFNLTGSQCKHFTKVYWIHQDISLESIVFTKYDQAGNKKYTDD